ncbi:cationic trypsin-like [Copidosoma floridanum]|uniref:cationic trypsin-like n=1 Tax=Copidosoma floridanum TaxID=29053 RepID=UPI000C6F5251|nr:cationic trypsin-like [Copidosoma floridanum]
MHPLVVTISLSLTLASCKIIDEIIFESTEGKGAQPAILKSAALIGGRKTLASEVKYLVSLQYDGEHICGGSIIEDRHVLSAAHCFIGDDNKFLDKIFKVVAGADDLNRDDNVVEAEVEKIYVPNEYNDAGWTSSVPLGDIAVLKLRQSLNLKENENLGKLRLPRASKHNQHRDRTSKHYRSYEGERVLIAGFGWDKVKVKTRKNRTEYEVGSSTDRLFSANAKVIGNAECQEHYTDTIHDGELCARIIEPNDDKPRGVCRGDSGSPLVYKSNTIIGVVSGISIGCNENNQPGIYCRVSSYLGFVRDALRGVTDRMRVKTF